MNTVYRAVLHGVAGFQKLVALKVLHPMRFDDPKLRDDLIKEARIGLTKTEFNNNSHKPGHKPINDLYAFEHLTVDAVAEQIIRLMFSDKDFEQINAK